MPYGNNGAIDDMLSASSLSGSDCSRSVSCSEKLPGSAGSNIGDAKDADETSLLAEETPEEGGDDGPVMPVPALEIADEEEVAMISKVLLRVGSIENSLEPLMVPVASGAAWAVPLWPASIFPGRELSLLLTAGTTPERVSPMCTSFLTRAMSRVPRSEKSDSADREASRSLAVVTAAGAWRRDAVVMDGSPMGSLFVSAGFFVGGGGKESAVRRATVVAVAEPVRPRGSSPVHMKAAEEPAWSIAAYSASGDPISYVCASASRGAATVSASCMRLAGVAVPVDVSRFSSVRAASVRLK